VPHGALTVGLLERWLEERGMQRRARRSVVWALGAHHGFLPTGEDVMQCEDPSVAGLEEWEEERRALLDGLFEAVEAKLPIHLNDLPDDVVAGLMAITSFSDWIASSAQHFPYHRDPTDARRYLEQACQLARDALERIGWFPRRPLAEGPMDFGALFQFPPNALQQTLADLIRGATEPLLVVVEAPMGAGKTEAALYAHLELQRGAQHRGLYVALPTMATGNGMFPRVKAFLQRFGNRPLDLQLQHGAALLNREYRQLQPRYVGDAADDSVLAREWFTPKKHAMLSEYGVGTVDQALLGVLRVRHHFVRLFGLANRTVVLDEIHAYDTYTSSLIETLVAWLGRLGSSVILMSATLPRARRARLVQAYGAAPAEWDTSYPRVTVATRSGHARSVSIPVERERIIRIRGVPRDTDRLAEEAKRLSEAGGCVACIVNTVDRAQQLYQYLAQGEAIYYSGLPVGRRHGDVEVFLFHARFPSDERRVREELILQLFGKEGYEKGYRPPKAILVATQVVEQSLDLDFDVMTSDLAPVDLLLQRAGRLHRFDSAKLGDWRRARPEAHREAGLSVAGLGPNLSSLDLEGWQEVYSPYILLRSWWILRELREITIPTDIQNLIEQVYGDASLNVPDEIREQFERARLKHEQEMQRQEVWARGVAVQKGNDLLESPDDLLSALRLEDDEEQGSQMPLTRYGEPSVGIIPLHRVGDGLYLDAQGKEPADLRRVPTDEQAERIFGRSVRLGGRWVYEAMRAVDPPQAWERHPLLRRLRPLEFTAGAATIGGRRVRLTPELGVIYDRVESK
jgi:CRISPR-associated endonuclease/helicase Cas3